MTRTYVPEMNNIAVLMDFLGQTDNAWTRHLAIPRQSTNYIYAHGICVHPVYLCIIYIYTDVAWSTIFMPATYARINNMQFLIDLPFPFVRLGRNS